MTGIPAKQLDGLGTPIETVEILPQPEQVLAGTQGTHALAGTYDGGSYVMRRAAACSKILLRLTAVTIAAQVRVLIYQRADGGGGVASKIASVSSAVLAAGAQQLTLTFSEGTVNFKPGLIYVLVGRPLAIACTLRVYSVSALDLINQNVDGNTHPCSFTTAISAAGADPATFNPNVDASPSTTDVVPICRLVA
jgi:hypothetical protein